MIARVWRGAVRKEDSEVYSEYMQETGVAGYATTPGNRASGCSADVDERTEFMMFTLWDSLAAVTAFAGDEYESAVFYPEDERFLGERDLISTHYRVDTHVQPADPCSPNVALW